MEARNDTIADEGQASTKRQTAQWWERYTTELESATDHYTTVFFRTLTPPPGGHRQRTEILELLKAAARRDLIDGYDVRVLGGDICLCTTCQGTEPAQQALETVTELAGWHDGQTTSTGFREREVDCSITSDQYRILVPPETAVGVYLDDSLTGVFPCVADGTHYSVESFLRTLLAGRDAVESETSPGPRQLR